MAGYSYKLNISAKNIEFLSISNIIESDYIEGCSSVMYSGNIYISKM